ncbi:MAG: nucleotidyl transferase AbiEii/AbiGii toxin family protein [Nanoarchaeota archaeon]|nr:nucleotidyl transferase AbiEii/AbiGii toxin family protein [Nanoarchaeota archaeon]MBU1135772.1 nucleotidyl transferase AbiEii/AbiGii toxin family protein [Nanoarchaeota archaeon]MBU2520430.1 nucleotidyl transferase AbiEii/AbiGii toxin family protein [Nanoarchaeota archaeon]
MDEIKRITQKELQDISGRTGFSLLTLVKDYYITLILYLLKDVDGLYFKGGTALQKIFFNHSRLSEDIDYTVTENVNSIKENIEKITKQSDFFEKITKDKHVSDFVRMIVHYKDPFGDRGEVFIDLNKRAKLVLKPESNRIPHFYPESIPDFSVQTLNSKELFAEKMAATIGRNKPRDHFDLYKIISNKMNLDLKLVKRKCKSSGHEFNITKMFNRANRLKSRWDKDMSPLLAEEISFQEIMRTLAKHFKYKEEKKTRKAPK